MSFAKFINDLAKPKITSFDHDFGGEVGVQRVYVRELTYKQRADLFISRWDKDGSIDPTKPEAGLYLNAELLATTLVDEKGKAVATKEAILQWPPALVDSLTNAVLAQINPKVDENPSPAAS